MGAQQVVLFATSCPATLKAKSDILRIKNLLDAKRVQYEEVDLSMEPQRREAMLAGSGGLRLIPQLHVNGRNIGSADELQELEDWGELNLVLQGLTPEEAAAAAAGTPPAVASHNTAAAVAPPLATAFAAGLSVLPASVAAVGALQARQPAAVPTAALSEAVLPATPAEPSASGSGSPSSLAELCVDPAAQAAPPVQSFDLPSAEPAPAALQQAGQAASTHQPASISEPQHIAVSGVDLSLDQRSQASVAADSTGDILSHTPAAAAPPLGLLSAAELLGEAPAAQVASADAPAAADLAASLAASAIARAVAAAHAEEQLVGSVREVAPGVAFALPGVAASQGAAARQDTEAQEPQQQPAAADSADLASAEPALCERPSLPEEPCDGVCAVAAVRPAVQGKTASTASGCACAPEAQAELLQASPPSGLCGLQIETPEVTPAQQASAAAAQAEEEGAARRLAAACAARPAAAAAVVTVPPDAAGVSARALKAAHCLDLGVAQLSTAKQEVAGRHLTSGTGLQADARAEAVAALAQAAANLPSPTDPAQHLLCSPIGLTP